MDMANNLLQTWVLIAALKIRTSTKHWWNDTDRGQTRVSDTNLPGSTLSETNHT